MTTVSQAERELPESSCPSCTTSQEAASAAHLDPQDHSETPDHKDLRASLDLWADRVNAERMVHQVQLVRLVTRDPLVSVASME